MSPGAIVTLLEIYATPVTVKGGFMDDLEEAQLITTKITPFKCLPRGDVMVQMLMDTPLPEWADPRLEAQKK